MKNLNLMKTAFLAVFVSLSGLVMAQKNYNLIASNLKVSGTSTLHDWEMTASQASGKATMKAGANGKVESISSLTVTMNSERIKSGKSGMDKKAYEALKSDTHKYVTYTLSSAKKNANGTWTFTGNFNIAGVSKATTITVTESTVSGAPQFSGSYGFKLSDYGITPPKALAGTIKTGNDVKITFSVRFN